MRARLLCSLRSECGSQSLNFGFAAVSAGRAGVIDHEEFATYMAQRSAGIAKQKELPLDWYRDEQAAEQQQHYSDPVAHPSREQKATWKVVVD